MVRRCCGSCDLLLIADLQSFGHSPGIQSSRLLAEVLQPGLIPIEVPIAMGQKNFFAQGQGLKCLTVNGQKQFCPTSMVTRMGEFLNESHAETHGFPSKLRRSHLFEIIVDLHASPFVSVSFSRAAKSRPHRSGKGSGASRECSAPCSGRNKGCHRCGSLPMWCGVPWPHPGLPWPGRYR